MILQAIEKQIGGTAKATANDTDKMKEGFRQFQQQLGSALLPVLAKITPLLTGLASWATKNKTAFIIIASVIGGIATAILATNAALAVYNTIQALTTALNTALTASFSALWVATGAVVIIAIIAALVALQVKFDIFGKTVDGIKYAFDKLWEAIKFVFDWAKNNWPLLLAIITGPFGPAILAVVTFKDQIMEVFSIIYNSIRATMGFIANVITAPFKAAFNAIARLWNNTVGKL